MKKRKKKRLRDFIAAFFVSLGSIVGLSTDSPKQPEPVPQVHVDQKTTSKQNIPELSPEVENLEEVYLNTKIPGHEPGDLPDDINKLLDMLTYDLGIVIGLQRKIEQQISTTTGMLPSEYSQVPDKIRTMVMRLSLLSWRMKKLDMVHTKITRTINELEQAKKGTTIKIKVHEQRLKTLSAQFWELQKSWQTILGNFNTLIKRYAEKAIKIAQGSVKENEHRKGERTVKENVEITQELTKQRSHQNAANILSSSVLGPIFNVHEGIKKVLGTLQQHKMEVTFHGGALKLIRARRIVHKRFQELVALLSDLRDTTGKNKSPYDRAYQWFFPRLSELKDK